MTSATPATSSPAPFVYPTSWGASWSTWWKGHAATATETEDALIKRGLGDDIPYSRDSAVHATATGRTATLRQVHLGGKDRYINVLEIGTGPRRSDEHSLVVAHGYGGALGFWFQSFRALSSVPNTRLYVIDLLGMGRSGRPSFPKPKITAKAGTGEAVRQRVSAAEDFFVESLEQWREQEGISKMTLMGHSLGGYFSSSYTIKHPERVNKLVLVSPVGVPEAPYDLPDPTDGDIAAIAEAEMRDSQAAVTADARGARAKAPNTWWARLWEANVSPFSVLRYSTFLAPKLMSTYAKRRYAAFPNDVQSELFAYLTLISLQRGSGEYALAHILAPGAYARWPLIHRLKPLAHPITFIYGDHDWMDDTGGRKALATLRAKPATEATALQRRRSKVVINPHSGHWVFLENPGGFNEIIVREIQEAVEDHSPA